jgi:hypothetical protein
MVDVSPHYKLESPDVFQPGLCTDTGKLIEHIYGFLMIAERILQKYEEKKAGRKG